MTRLATLAAVAALTTACGSTGLPTAKTEADAYQVARVANDSTAVLLDVATMTLHASVEADAAARAERCSTIGANAQTCAHEGALKALEAGQPVADAIDKATAVQHELRRFLVAYGECAPGPEDALCRARALAEALSKSPAVLEAAKAAREVLRNARPAQ